MKTRIIALILRGAIDADAGAILIDEKGIEVTDTMYDELRAAEAQCKRAAAGIQVDDTVLVKGLNGNADFKANYRGKAGGGLVCVVPEKGLQMLVKEELVSKYN